jgi:hypothetical protein
LAKREKVDRGVAARLDEFEKRLFVLKIEYEKYFSGLERIEPTRERDELRRMLRDLSQEPMTNGRQRYRLQQLRARYGSTELYWTRNLVQIERGTHPRMKFRAAVHERERRDASLLGAARSAPPPEDVAREREDRAYQAIYERYIEARRQCGQSTELSLDAVRDALKKQVKTIKSTYRCSSVKFRVTIEEGKAKVKAVPVQ